MFPSRGLVVKSLLLVVLCAAVVGCPTPNPRQLAIQVTPSLLEFGTGDTPQTIEVRTNQDTEQEITVTSTVPASAPWLSVEPAIGRLTTPTSAFTATVHVDRTKLKKGLNTATISVGSPGLVSRAVTVTASTLMAADFTADPKEVWQGEEIAFEDLSEVASGETAITSWFWDFGDGATSIKQNPTHAYATAGKKSVVLTVSSKDSQGNIKQQDVETKLDYINVLQKRPPIAAFTTNPPLPDPDRPQVISIKAGESIEFTDQSDKPTAGTATITSWYWDFGDGQSSTLRNPSHTYTIGGRFTVSLTVTSEHGSDTETKSELVFVLADKPEANFTTVPADNLQANSSITFKDASAPGTAPIVSWVWDFGDGTQATVQNPLHTYTKGGTYTVSLTVATVHGTDTMTHDITVVERAPEANFDFTPASPKVNDTVQFTDQSEPGTARITAWEWNFGDNSALSTLKNPTHKYTKQGTYTVSLKVVSEHGEDSVDFPVVVRTEAPTASFTATPTSSYVNHNIQFTSTSIPGTAPITSWLWTFGDGEQSTDPNPVHKYAQTGKYAVSLTVTSPHGQHTATVPNYITVAPAVAPTANFAMSNAKPYEADEVSFTDTSTNGTATITTWRWEFGDGVTSAERNPVHVYAQPGTFQVTLTVTSPDGTNSKTQNIEVVPNVDPVANFSATPLTPLAGTSVKFKDLSTPGTAPIISWLWNFGDTLTTPADNTSSEQNPSHVYGAPGFYSVTLKVATLHGTHELTKTQYVQVQPRVDFTATPTSAAVGKRVQFVDLTNAGTSTVASRLWDFGDGTTGTEEKPVHLYGREGTFTVKLTVTLANGATGSLTKTNYITVSIAGPTANFTVSNLQPVMFESVAFSDTSDPGSGNLVRWAWNFGDGTTSNAKSPFHTYNAEGTYTVTLRVTNSFDPEVDGNPAWASSTATKTIVVGGPTPLVEFSQDKTVVLRDMDTVTFTSHSSIQAPGRIYTYQWRVWQGDPAAEPGLDFVLGQNEVFTTSAPTSLQNYPFHKPGYYHVMLTVFSSTMTDPGDPNNPDNVAHFKATSIKKENAIEVREPSELDKFVQSPSPDPEFRYNLRNTITGPGYKAFFVDMTSQRWYGGSEEDTTAALWKHTLTIIQPDALTNETALLYLDGGDRTAASPTTVNAKLAQFAVDSGSVVVVVSGLPNQPLLFPQRLTQLSEDELVAASLDQFYETGDVKDLVLFAMVKGAVRAMDAAQGFLADPAASGNIPPLELNGFVVTGGSDKGWSRGWATWLTAIADTRVKAIMPMGFDALNLLAQFPLQKETLGKYSEALNPYVQPPTLGFDVYAQMQDSPWDSLAASDAMLLQRGISQLREMQLELLEDIRDNTFRYQAQDTANDLSNLPALRDLLKRPLHGRDVGVVPDTQLLYAYYPMTAIASANGACQALFDKVAAWIDTAPTDTVAAVRELAGQFNNLYSGDIGNCIHALELAQEALEKEYPGSWSILLLDPIYYSYQYVQVMQSYSEFGGRLSMPKYILNSTGDVFTAPDSSSMYFGYLAGDKSLRYFPNTEHNLGGLPEAVYSALPWYRQVVTGVPRPDFTWTYLSDQQLLIRANGEQRPTEVKLWVAQSADRDFRRDAVLNPDSPQWIASTLTADSEGKYYTQMRPTLDKYTAYFAELTYASNDGKPLVYTTDIKVLAPYTPVANFTATTQTPDVNDPVQFFDLTRPGVAPIATWVWDFGDGTTSTQQHPVHRYTLGGTYTVTLRVTSAYGSDVETKVDYIVATQVKPLARFTADDFDAEIDQLIHFTDQSIQGKATITSWLWDFGDGTTSTSQNPTHKYSTADSYTVTLTVTSSLGSNTLVKSDYILVTQVKPVAKFSADLEQLPILVPVQFKDNSIPGASPILQWSWDFGDGTTSAAQNPTHAYTAMGKYTVKLTVRNAAGQSTLTKTEFITATPDVSASPMNPAVAQAVKFTAVVGSASVKSYAWQFGDGFTSNLPSPVHQYGRAGIFDVTLKIVLQDGAVWTVVKPGFMNVGSALPVASFTASDYSPMPNEMVIFTDTTKPGSAEIVEWVWNFGDGASSRSQSPYHTYTSPGTYTVTLSVKTLFGTDSASAQIVVEGVAPQASFTIDKKIAYRQVDEITFTSTSTVAGEAKFLAYYWYAKKTDDDQIPTGSIGSGEVCVSYPSEENRLTYPFHEAGTYTVMLVVYASRLDNPGDPLDPRNAGNFVSSTLVKENVLEIREPTALDRFVHSDKDSYTAASLQSRTRGSVDGVGYTTYVINLVAHSWETYTASQPTPKDWRHWLTIVQPDNLNNNTALMYLEAGDRAEQIPASVDPLLAKFAVNSGSVVSALRNVPNQPLLYNGKIMSEDTLMAATMDGFLKSSASASSTASLNVLFPMVKSVVQGMDAVQNFLGDAGASGNIPPLNIENFVLAGGSETGLTRGWVTWLAPTTDERVRGIIPIGFDFLNLDQQLPYQHEMLNGYSSVLADYAALPPLGYNVFNRLLATHPESGMAAPILVHKDLRFLQRYQRLMLHDGWLGDKMTWLPELNAHLYDMVTFHLGGMGPDAYDAYALASELYSYTSALLDQPPPKETWPGILSILAGSRFPIYFGQMGDLGQLLMTLEETQYTKNRGPYESYLVDPLYYGYPFTQSLNWWSPYGGRLNIPKYIVNSTGDQFSMPDAAQFYMGHIAGTNHLRYYPNTDHALNGYSEAVYDALPWFNSLVNSDVLPKFLWEYKGDGFISLSFPDNILPSSVTLWVAVSDDGSDFRYDTVLNPNPPQWFSSDVPVVLDAQRHITLQVFPSVTETSAYYIELTYPSADGGTFTTTTPVRIVQPYDSPFKSAKPSTEPEAPLVAPEEAPETK